MPGIDGRLGSIPVAITISSNGTSSESFGAWLRTTCAPARRNRSA
jgi:hypothetical protein